MARAVVTANPSTSQTISSFRQLGRDSRTEVPVYVQITEKAMQLRDLRMSDKAIARALGVSDKTVAKAIELRTKHIGPTG